MFHFAIKKHDSLAKNGLSFDSIRDNLATEEYVILVRVFDGFKTVQKDSKGEYATVSKVEYYKSKVSANGEFLIFASEEDKQYCFCCENEIQSREANRDYRIDKGFYFLDKTSTSVSLPKGHKKSFLVSNEFCDKERRIICPHVGNSGKDTAGCLLFGKSISSIGVSNSIKACMDFLDYCQEINKGLLIKES